MTIDSTSASSSKPHADPSTEASDRDARVSVRRQRIDARNASKDDASRKKQLQVGDSQRMSRGQQQVAESLNQLDRRKLAGIRHVTSVRVEADDAENRRRVEEEERRHKRVEKLQQEAIDSGAKNAAVEMRWADLFEFSMPQELHNELELQNRACSEILASKDAVIREFQNQLKAKDEEYVTALKGQAEEVEKLVDRMSQQYREMQDEYEIELEQMEDAFMKERDELIANNKLEIDSLFERRREMEMVYMEAKQTRDEQYLQEIEDLRVRDAEDYNELKIKLETNIQTLEQQLEEMRATYQLNTEKLEYNYRVLTERDMENSATLSQQKRKLARLKDALATLITKYNQTDARDRHQNEELTEEYRRLTKQYRDLQKKYAHFETSDSNKYDDVWQMHEEEAIRKIDKLLDADRIIHEQQLGLAWRPPSQSIRNWSHSAKAGDVAALQKQLENGDESFPDSAESEKGSRRDDDPRDQDDFDDESVEAYTPPVKKISGAKLKYMLKMLASEAGFLVNGSVQQALENLPDDEAELVKADMIMRTLGVDNEEDMEKLMGYFFEDPRQEVLVDSRGGDNNKESDSPGKDSNTSGSNASWGLVVGPEDVIRVIKRFVEEMSEQKRAVPVARILHRSASGESEQGKKNSKGSSSAALKVKARKIEKEYWLNIVKVFPAQKIRVMATLEKGLTHYNTALLRRKELIDDVTAMKAQNAELKRLLKQYLAAPINEDLIVPPTQMQLYQ
ncbi:hypothetical protein KRP22_008385 [Phytophthora ramorum]|uniref:Dynein regulatory complex protein 1 n=1 Tax=Phytophthora ramorum TaxID=164328 RepID=H3GY05_PHYRM|nr:Dynein regulatory complex protein 1 [Phytophthora ramorum]KAH7505629.1 Dynein regulatory complex protein 1 [Phytophthora ramorum]